MEIQTCQSRRKKDVSQTPFSKYEMVRRKIVEENTVIRIIIWIIIQMMNRHFAYIELHRRVMFEDWRMIRRKHNASRNYLNNTIIGVNDRWWSLREFDTFIAIRRDEGSTGVQQHGSACSSVEGQSEMEKTEVNAVLLNDTLAVDFDFPATVQLKRFYVDPCPPSCARFPPPLYIFSLFFLFIFLSSKSFFRNLTHYNY